MTTEFEEWQKFEKAAMALVDVMPFANDECTTCGAWMRDSLRPDPTLHEAEIEFLHRLKIALFCYRSEYPAECWRCQMSDQLAQEFLEQAEDLRNRAGGQRLSKLSEEDQNLWLNVSRELTDLLECCPSELSAATKGRIDQFLAWSPFDRTDELILDDQIAKSLEMFKSSRAEDWQEYLRHVLEQMGVEEEEE